jgi:hypothetical protein
MANHDAPRERTAMTARLRWLVVVVGVLGLAVSADAQWLTQTPAPALARPEDKVADHPGAGLPLLLRT